MDEHDVLAQRFEEYRPHLRRIGYRMLGSAVEADDAVQEAWLRIARADATSVDNLKGWMTTIVGRVCLDMLRTRNARGEEAFVSHEPELAAARGHEPTPDENLEIADSVGLALLVVLETLEPAERVAFVLHDMFDLTFDEIAPIVGRSTVATRQLASRARRRVHGAPKSDVDRSRKREIVDAFIAASKSGDFEALVAVLDPDVVLRTDAQGIRMGGPAEARGARTVAGFFHGRAQAAVPALIDGDVGIAVRPKGRLLLVLALSYANGKITAIDAVADRDALGELELEDLGAASPG